MRSIACYIQNSSRRRYTERRTGSPSLSDAMADEEKAVLAGRPGQRDWRKVKKRNVLPSSDSERPLETGPLQRPRFLHNSVILAVPIAFWNERQRCYNGGVSTPDPIVATSRKHLGELIREAKAIHGDQCDLNHIDVSAILDFSWVFSNMLFNGNVSEWNVSNGTNFEGMFENQPFTGDISRWDVSTARSMRAMFRNSAFNGDLSGWDVSNVKYIARMFERSAFAQNISMWSMPMELETSEFHKLYDENKHFLAAQSVSPWIVRLHLANGTVPSKPGWTDAFDQALALAQGLDLPLEEHAHAIVAIHASMHSDGPPMESIGGTLFESVA